MPTNGFSTYSICGDETLCVVFLFDKEEDMAIEWNFRQAFDTLKECLKPVYNANNDKESTRQWTQVEQASEHQLGHYNIHVEALRHRDYCSSQCQWGPHFTHLGFVSIFYIVPIPIPTLHNYFYHSAVLIISYGSYVTNHRNAAIRSWRLPTLWRTRTQLS